MGLIIQCYYPFWFHECYRWLRYQTMQDNFTVKKRRKIWNLFKTKSIQYYIYNLYYVQIVSTNSLFIYACKLCRTHLNNWYGTPKPPSYERDWETWTVRLLTKVINNNNIPLGYNSAIGIVGGTVCSLDGPFPDLLLFFFFFFFFSSPSPGAPSMDNGSTFSVASAPSELFSMGASFSAEKGNFTDVKWKKKNYLIQSIWKSLWKMKSRFYQKLMSVNSGHSKVNIDFIHKIPTLVFSFSSI